jgi:hypothetical protein
MASGPIVQVDFNLNGDQSGQIRITNPDVSAVNAVSAESRASNTSFDYSGRHDHGDLPSLKSSGDHALLVAALQEAKRECDRFLTQKINIEFGYDNGEEAKMECDATEAVEEDEVGNKTKKVCTEKDVGRH